MIRLDQSKRDEIGSNIRLYVNACDSEKSRVQPRWEEIRGHYNLDKAYAGHSIYEDMEGERVPFYRPACDRVQQALSGAYYSVDPWAQLMPNSAYKDKIEAENELREQINELMQVQAAATGVEPETELEEYYSAIPDLERTMQRFCERSNLRDQHSIVFRNMVHSNCGVMRVRVDEDGTLCADNIHPENALFYPVKVSDYKRLMCIGHRFQIMRYEIAEKVEDGEYYSDIDPMQIGTATESLDPVNKDIDVTVDLSTDLVDLYEFYIKLKLGNDKKREWYIGVADAVSGVLLRLVKSPYSRPWYFVFRTSFDEDSMLPMYSLGTTLVPLQRTINNIWSLMVQGGYMSAFPMTIISGASGIQNKVQKMKAGQVLFENENVNVQQVRLDFNPSVFPSALQYIQQVGDTVTGFSRLGQSQTLPAGTTATAANGMLAAQDASKDAYVEAVQTVMSDMFRFILELMATHPHEIAKAMGGAWELRIDDDIAWKDIDVQVTGSGATSSPALLMQKLQMLMELSSNPESGLSPKDVIDMMVQTLDLPFSVEAIKAKNENQPELGEGEMGGVPPIAGMEPGMPPVGIEGAGIHQQIGQLGAIQ